jgi:hypothetical protein
MQFWNLAGISLIHALTNVSESGDGDTGVSFLNRSDHIKVIG